MRPNQLQLRDLIILQDGTSFEVEVPQLPLSDETAFLRSQTRLSTHQQVAYADKAPCSNKLSHCTTVQCGSRTLDRTALDPGSQQSHPPDHSSLITFAGVSFVQSRTITPRRHKDEPTQPVWHQNMQRFNNAHNEPPPVDTPGAPSTTEHDTPSQGDDFGEDPSEPPNTPSGVHPPPDNPNRQSVMLFQCGHAPLHAYIAWHNHDATMQEIANHCLVPLHHIMYLYDLQYRPLGLQTDIYPMIVHMDFDLDPGSFEQLCLVDVEPSLSHALLFSNGWTQLAILACCQAGMQPGRHPTFQALGPNGVDQGWVGGVSQIAAAVSTKQNRGYQALLQLQHIYGAGMEGLGRVGQSTLP